MQQSLQLVPWLLAAAGIAVFAVALLLARRRLGDAGAEAERLLAEAEQEAENERKESAVATQERALALEEEAEQRERAFEEREAASEQRQREVERQASEVGRERSSLERKAKSLAGREKEIERLESEVGERATAARAKLERIAGLTAEQARAELIERVESEAHHEAARIAKKIEEDARQGAERNARNLILQASQKVNIRDVMESTVSFIELPSDEMKGRIIGKEGRNIRALEMATGIDLIVDDTPRSIWISCFDPVRREVARVAIDRLLVDGRIHPARIEEVVQQVAGEIDELIEGKGHDAAFSVGITDLHPQLARLVGRMRYHTSRGQNLLQHCLEVATIAAHMTQELGGRAEIALRAGLLHEVSQVSDGDKSVPALDSSELCAKYRETPEIVDAVHSLQGDVQPATIEALLLHTANRLSDNRPGARKENLAVFIERLRRLEAIAGKFDGVRKAYAVKAGKELRVIVDIERVRDEQAYGLSKEIARSIERELSYPGQIKICVVRETRAVRFAV